MPKDLNQLKRQLAFAGALNRSVDHVFDLIGQRIARRENAAARGKENARIEAAWRARQEFIHDLKNRQGKNDKDTVARLQKFRSTVLGDKQFAGSRKAVGASKTARSLIEKNNPISANAVRTLMPRLLGEVGNLSRSEQEAFGSSQQVGDKIEQLFTTLTTGSLSAVNQKFLLEIVDILGGHAARRGNDILDNYINSEVSIGAVNENSLRAVMKPFSFENIQIEDIDDKPKEPQLDDFVPESTGLEASEQEKFDFEKSKQSLGKGGFLDSIFGKKKKKPKNTNKKHESFKIGGDSSFVPSNPNDKKKLGLETTFEELDNANIKF